MVHSQLDFLEPYGAPNSGVDHLGLRVAGESVYTQLVDFITTVSWRPRYFSFLSWALQVAWERTASEDKDDMFKINMDERTRIIRRLDYVVCAASALGNGSSEHLSGVNKINKALEYDPMPVKADHLQASLGSFSIYGGSMRNLKLLDTAGTVDRPSARGRELAGYYEASIGKHKDALLSVLDGTDSVSHELLLEMSEAVGINAFEAEDLPRQVEEERDAIRNLIFGPEAESRRRFSVGLLLHLAQLSEGKADLMDFRTFTQHHGIVRGVFEQHELLRTDLPPVYGEVCASWAMYQSQAFITQALENLLSRALHVAPTLEEYPGAGLDPGTLIAELIGSRDDDKSLNQPLSDLVVVYESQVEKGLDADILERTISESADYPTTSIQLFLFALVRIRKQVAESKNGWNGTTDPLRLPPTVLIDDLEEYLHQGIDLFTFSKIVLEKYVLRQHYSNALRKLEATPSMDTARFTFEGDRLIPLGHIRPGTSHPRFANAMFFLQDLGYLDPYSIPTDYGREFLKQIEGSNE